MINVDNKVKNIYYMLCYSFYGELLNEKDEAVLGAEAFDNIYNLFSLLLCMILKKQIKKGMYKDYNYVNNEINTVKGKIDISKTINNNSLLKKKIICDYDEYNENNLLNKIIKTTIFYLIKSNKIGITTKDNLKRLSNYFNNVEIIEIKNIKWDQLRFNRNNMSYKYVTDLCKLILNGLIVSDKKGNNKFKEFLDDTRVSAIYENFVKAYYRKHYPEFNAMSRKFYLTKNSNSNFIPMMKTDITLEYNSRMLIIDAKFYNKILKDNYLNTRCRTISNNNLYQIITYVDNQDPHKTGNVYGMLLYAQTVDEPTISITEELNEHKIMIRTLDMNSEWNNIKNSLNVIAECFKNDSFQ
jgi:5-methylcytosine-specific restriction enzyme subunit McrC